jgi:hypothetical protein
LSVCIEPIPLLALSQRTATGRKTESSKAKKKKRRRRRRKEEKTKN